MGDKEDVQEEEKQPDQKEGGETEADTTLKNDESQIESSTKCTESERERNLVLLKTQASHCRQYKKHLLALLAISMSLVVNFVRGSKKAPSILKDFDKCGLLDWGIFFFFVMAAILLSVIGVWINKKE